MEISKCQISFIRCYLTKVNSLRFWRCVQMNDDKWLFEKGCFLGNWCETPEPEKKETPVESVQKTQSKDMDTLLNELDEIKQHIQDVRLRGWQIAKLIEFHNNDFAKE